MRAGKGGFPLDFDALTTLYLALASGLVAGWLGRGLGLRLRPGRSGPAPAADELDRLAPEAVRRLFSASSRRAVGPLALQIVQELFEPEQAAFLHARPADCRLSLAVGHGLPPELGPGLEVAYGEGPLGLAAEHKRVLDAADFASLPSEARRRLEAGATPGLSVEAAAPVVDEAGELIGVLGLSGARLRRGREKRVLSLLASLTGLAVTHVTRLRATQQIAEQDALTGTFNKRYFQQRLAEEVARAEREKRSLSLLLLDIDYFKNYNDSNGHLEGDHALKQLGHILNASIREDDTAARYGGDEFLVLLPGAGKERACALAEHLRRALEAQRLAQGSRQAAGVLTLSAGVATFPEDAESEVGLIRAADQALYEAKALGRNRVVAARPGAFT